MESEEILLLETLLSDEALLWESIELDDEETVDSLRNEALENEILDELDSETIDMEELLKEYDMLEEEEESWDDVDLEEVDCDEKLDSDLEAELLEDELSELMSTKWLYPVNIFAYDPPDDSEHTTALNPSYDNATFPPEKYPDNGGRTILVQSTP